MNAVHKTLHLQHHKHSFRLLHHRHTSYRGLAVVFVLAGLCIVGLNALSRATADSLLGVTGLVLPPVPSAPANIDVPAAGSTVTTGTIGVAGSCPLASPQVVVALLVDGNRAGSAICDANNDFVGQVSLTPGTHSLAAQVYSIVGQAGQISPPLQISYTAAASSAAGGLEVSSGQALSFVGSDKTASWAGTIGGGQPPYVVSADWGDGDRQTYDAAAAGVQQFSHGYANVGSHNVVLTVADAAGNRYVTQFAAAAFTDYTPAAATLAGGSDGQPFSASAAFGLYGLFLTTLAVTGIVWIEGRKVRREHRFAS